MHQYLNLLDTVMKTGVDKKDRTGTGTRSIFGHQMRFDLQKGFPLVTTKKVFFRGIVHELLWFISGSTNIKYLVDNDVHIWDGWADENGELGPVYGAQWRGTNGGVDQLSSVIETIRANPDSRRMIVSSWNVNQIDDMKLPPCHCLFQFYVSNNTLSCHLYQRSCDLFLGVPFNIASYALLTEMVAGVTGLMPGEFIWTGGDCHIYNNHFDQVELQLSRTPMLLPEIKVNPAMDNINDFEFRDIILCDYNSYPVISAPISI